MHIIEPLLYIAISQSFFAGLVLSTKKPFTMANKMMSAWLFLICIEMIFALINQNLLLFYSFPFIAFTYGPLLYLYTRHTTLRKSHFDHVNYLHFLPFLLFFALSVWQRDYQLFGNPEGFFRPDSMISLRIVYSAGFFISVSLYSILTFIEIRRHQRSLRDRLSYTSVAATLNWLKIISISFYSAYLILFILGGINILGTYFPFDPYYLVFIFVVVISFACSFYAVNQPLIFSYDDHEPAGSAKPANGTVEKYTRSGLKTNQAEAILKQLLKTMDDNKPYLNRDLTIYDLSAMTGISRHYITQVLNEHHGKNFFSFINEYRVNEAANRMGNIRYANYTILAIAYDSGFNSKSAFNRFFRDQMGMTPSEYRESLLTPGR
jgi:AraC-like DNA-binding protein